MIVVKITDLFTKVVFKIKQCDECQYVHTGDSCPRCDEYMDFDPEDLGLVVPEDRVAQEMLSWDQLYRRW